MRELLIAVSAVALLACSPDPAEDVILGDATVSIWPSACPIPEDEPLYTVVIWVDGDGEMSEGGSGEVVDVTWDPFNTHGFGWVVVCWSGDKGGRIPEEPLPLPVEEIELDTELVDSVGGFEISYVVTRDIISAPR